MSDPVRLLASTDATDLERQLLQSWEDERPSSSARDKTLAFLGVTSSVMGAGALVSASVAPKAVTAGWIVMAKWTGISLLALSAIGIGVGFAFRHREANTPVTQAKIETPANVVTAAPTIEATEIVPVASAIAPTSHAQARAMPSASLSDQIAALDHARSALENGDMRGARKLADAYEAQYPSGAFVQEADVVRIDAFVREGNHDAADRAAKHFLGAYPKSPHASRVRTLLGYDP